MDSRIAQIIEKAVQGGELSEADLRSMFSLHYLSEEAYMIKHASRKLSEKAILFRLFLLHRVAFSLNASLGTELLASFQYADIVENGCVNQYNLSTMA